MFETTLGNFLDVFGPLLVRKDGTTAAQAKREQRALSSDKWGLLLDDDIAIPAAQRAEAYMAFAAALRTRADAAIDARRGTEVAPVLEVA